MLNKTFFSSTSMIPNNWIYLKRPQLDKFIKNSIQLPITTVVAGAGYGKTQTVYNFLQEYDAITIWQQLTPLDNIVTRYWHNLINIISLYNDSLASDLNTLGFPETAAQFELFLCLLLDKMCPDKKCILVFDDFHLIHTKKILRLVERLINACIPNFSIILISRSDPEINTVMLLSKGLLSSICEDDLRFSKSDIARYFELQDIIPSLKVISKIYNDTAGWIIAVRLIEHSFKKGIPYEKYGFDTIKLNIFKMIESGIFSVASRDLQIFLVKLSLFDNLSLDLLEELALNNTYLITEISKISSFIRFESFANVYHIHHLFLDFLIQHQHMLTKSEKNECYLLAAKWYALKGYNVDAITCYKKIGGYDEIIKICLVFPHVLPQDIAAFLLGLLDRTPKEVYEKSPLLSIVRARMLFSVSKVKEAQDEMEDLRRKYENLPQSLENRSILCEVYLIMGLFTFVTCLASNEYDFQNYFMRACRCMPEGSAVMKDKNTMQNIGPYICRVSEPKKGYMEKYIDAVMTCVPLASKVLYGYMYGYDDLALAELAYFKNNRKISEQLAYQALFKAQEKGQHEIENRALFYLIRIKLSAGDYLKIQDLMKQLDLQLKRTKYKNSYTLHDLVTSWYYSMIGQSDKVACWVKREFEKSELNLVLSGLENLVRIRYYLSRKKYHEILAFFESQNNKYSIEGFLLGKITVATAKAVCLHQMKETDKAIEALQKAYKLAEPNSLTMTFIELGNNMVSLAKVALKSESCTIPAGWLENILRKSSTYAKRISYVTSEYRKANHLESDLQSKLTQKEIGFLTDLCHGLSRAEIAANYSLSMNSVKNKLQIIFFKLGARNAKDAIRIASLMNLIK